MEYYENAVFVPLATKLFTIAKSPLRQRIVTRKELTQFLWVLV
jgi:hypothetical protein